MHAGASRREGLQRELRGSCLSTCMPNWQCESKCMPWLDQPGPSRLSGWGMLVVQRGAELQGRLPAQAAVQDGPLQRAARHPRRRPAEEGLRPVLTADSHWASGMRCTRHAQQPSYHAPSWLARVAHVAAARPRCLYSPMLMCVLAVIKTEHQMIVEQLWTCRRVWWSDGLCDCM